MAKKKKYSSLFRSIILLINLGLVVLLLLSYLSYFIAPKTLPFIAFCGLGFPYIALANGFFVIFWCFIYYPFGFISLVALLIGVQRIDALYQFRGESKPDVLEKSLKVMSFNARLFGAYSSGRQQMLQDRRAIFRYLEEEQPDIVCFQEYFDDFTKKYFPISDSLLKILQVKPENHFVYTPVNLQKKYYYGMGIYSKYKIVNTGYMVNEKSLTNTVIFADIVAFKDTIRVFNLHLTSFHFGEEDYKIGEELLFETQDKEQIKNKVRQISNKLRGAFITRGTQADSVIKFMASSPYPVIVCGDFNDTPSSYTYRVISKGLKDSFRESGKGFATTYNGTAFPSFRIDYILHSSKFKSYDHTVSKHLTTSDHFPIHCWIGWQKER